MGLARRLGGVTGKLRGRREGTLRAAQQPLAPAQAEGKGYGPALRRGRAPHHPEPSPPVALPPVVFGMGRINSPVVDTRNSKLPSERASTHVAEPYWAS